MKHLCYLLLFCWCGQLYSDPSILQYLVNLLPRCCCKRMKTVPLSLELKEYLACKIADKPESETIATFDMSNLKDFCYCSLWCKKCWNFNSEEIEQILYKFYEKETCPYQENLLYFLGFCLSVYEGQKELESPLDLKNLSIIHWEHVRINKLFRVIRSEQ